MAAQAAVFSALIAGAVAAAGAADAPATPGTPATPARTLRFEQAFATPRSPSLHYEARFTDAAGAAHQLQAWRDGDRRLKRRTDDAIELHAVHRPGDAEYAMTVLDLRRRILTRIARTNLLRIGNFTDWSELAHALKHPRGTYTLASEPAPAAAPRPVAACRWYALTQAGHVRHICWSARAELPLLVTGDDGRAAWQVTRLQPGAVPAGIFEVDARDYVVNDADADIAHD